mgnify:FL=1
MLELIAICMMYAAGDMIKPEPPWQIVEVRAEREVRSLNQIMTYPPTPSPPPDRVRVTMKRQIGPGESAEAPKNCTVRVERKEK